MSTADFPPQRGTYLLRLTLLADEQLTIGRLGTFDLTAGVYVYVGSAFGAGGLAGRLRHHLRPAERPHWHIDYLRRAAHLESIWYQAADTRREHDWAQALAALPGATIPIARFGASDCTCAAHLFVLPAASMFAVFQARLAALFPDDTPLCVWATCSSPPKD